jgi:hypothetical protein
MGSDRYRSRMTGFSGQSLPILRVCEFCTLGAILVLHAPSRNLSPTRVVVQFEIHRVAS